HERRRIGRVAQDEADDVLPRVARTALGEGARGAQRARRDRSGHHAQRGLGDARDRRIALGEGRQRVVGRPLGVQDAAMVPFFDAREKTAARLLDVASALDAGLPPKTALRVDEADLKDGVAAAVVRAIPGLDDVDLRILEAAERAGDLSAALRERAEAKLQHAGVARDLVRRLAYPAFVLAFAVVLSLWLASVGQAGFSSKAVTLLALAPLACAAAVVVVVRRARRDPGFDAARVPLLGAVLRDAAELPYLIALRGLHAAGVLIADAHATAAATSGVAHVRAR